MPELPEVETVVRSLRPKLLGRVITQVQVKWPRIVDRPALVDFEKQIKNQKIEAVTRRAKFIIIKFVSGNFLLVHLRMSGNLVHKRQMETPSKHVHASFLLQDGSQLWFEDTRKFGRLYLVEELSGVTSRLGPEPLSTDFSVDGFASRLKSRRTPIKVFLLDQSLVAGLGNIYVIESLWRAKIHPSKPSALLTPIEVKELHHSIIEVLTEAITKRGTDIGDGVWKHGLYSTQVYGRAGNECSRCKKIIAHYVLSQRGTDFCPSCQQL